MATTALKGKTVNTCGDLPKVGERAPEFELTKSDLSRLKLSELKGKKVVLNIFPSLDTSVCAMTVRRFNQEAGALRDTVVLCISMDLPFAQGRFCAAEGLKNVVTLSDFRTGAFGRAYGVRQIDGPQEGLLARAVIVLDPQGVVKYVQLVPEISQEPDYAKALAAAA
jgi:thiol peroxidase